MKRFKKVRAATAAAVGGLFVFAGPLAAQQAPAQQAPVQAAPATQPPPAPASGPAAPAITAEGAQALAKALADELAAYIPPGPNNGVVGAPVVMPSGDGYVAVLPGLSLRAEQERFDFGAVWLTLKPLPDGAYAVDVKLPGSAVVMKDGDPQAVLTLGEQKIVGVWSPALQSFLSFEGQMTDLQITSVYDDFWVGVGSLNFMQHLTPEAAPGDGWSGPSTAALSEVRIEKGEDALLSIGALTAETQYSRFRLDKLAQLMQTARGAADGKPEASLSTVFNLLQGVVGGANSRIRLNDVAATDPDTKQSVGLDHLSFNIGGADFDRPAASVELGFDLRGLTFDPQPIDEAALPTAAELKLALYNIPVAELLKLADGVVAGKAPAGDPVEAALRIIENAKTTLVLDKLRAESAALQATASGDAFPSAASAVGAVAKAKLTLVGVDKLLNDLKPKKGAKPDPATAELTQGLTVLQTMGRPEKDKSGKTALTYTFEITPQGAFLLNGADVSPLLEGVQ